MKKLVVPRCLEGVEDELFFADAFLFGVKDLSVQFENTYPIEKLKEVSSFLHQHGKKIFVSCNKNYDKKLRRYKPKFLCMEDSEYVDDKDRKRGKDFLEALFPNKSEFEK